MDKGDPDLVQEMLGLREAKNGTNSDELLQARASGHKRIRQHVKADLGPRGWQGSGQGCEED